VRVTVTSNDLSPRRVLDHGVMHVMAADEWRRRRRLASGADLHASERYDGACYGDIKRPVAQTSCGPRCDACDGSRRVEMAMQTGLRR